MEGARDHEVSPVQKVNKLLGSGIARKIIACTFRGKATDLDNGLTCHIMRPANNLFENFVFVDRIDQDIAVLGNACLV